MVLEGLGDSLRSTLKKIANAGHIDAACLTRRGVTPHRAAIWPGVS